MRILAALLLLVAPLGAATVVTHADGTTTTWASNNWGDGTSSTSTGGLSGAIANAIAGDKIQCDHSVTYTQPNTSTSITLPNFTGTTPVQLYPDTYRALPNPGTRVQASDAANMCQILAHLNFSAPVITSAAGAHDFLLDGLNITVASGGTNVSFSYLINLGLTAGSPAYAVQNYPQRIAIRRSIISGTYNEPGPCRAIGMDGIANSVSDSILAEAKETAQDCQALFSLSCTGCSATNNQISGLTENFMNGGSPTSVAGYLSRGWTLQGNDFVSDIRWRTFFAASDPSVGDTRASCVYYAAQSHGEKWQNNTTGTIPNPTSTGNTWECQSGGTWNSLGSQTLSTVYGNASVQGAQSGGKKNNFEIKHGHDFRVRGNMFRNSWANNQDELIILNGPDANTINSTRGIQNVVLEYSILRDTHQAIQAGSGFASLPTADPMSGVVIHDLLIDTALQNNRAWPGTSSTGALLASPAFNVSQTGFPRVSVPGGWVYRNITAVNSATGSSAIFNYTAGNQATNVRGPFPIGVDIHDNIFPLGGGVTGGCGPAINSVFSYGGALSVGCVSQVLRYWAPNSLFHHNIVSKDGQGFTNTANLLGTNGTGFNDVNAAGGGCCFTNYLPTSVNSVLVNVAGGDYHVKNSATGCNPDGTNTTGAPSGNCITASTTGGAPGGDIDMIGQPGVNGLTAGTISGAANPNLNFNLNLPVQLLSSTSASLQFQAPSSSACTVTVSQNASLAPAAGSHALVQHGLSVTDTITGLTTAAQYYGKVTCPDAVNGGTTNLTLPFSFYLGPTPTLGQYLQDLATVSAQEFSQSATDGLHISMNATHLPGDALWINLGKGSCNPLYPTGGGAACTYNNVAVMNAYTDGLANLHAHAIDLVVDPLAIAAAPNESSSSAYTGAISGTDWTCPGGWYCQTLQNYDGLIAHAIAAGVAVHLRPTPTAALLTACGLSSSPTEANFETCWKPLLVAMAVRWPTADITIIHEAVGIFNSVVTLPTPLSTSGVTWVHSLVANTATAIHTANSATKVGATGETMFAADGSFFNDYLTISALDYVGVDLYNSSTTCAVSDYLTTTLATAHTWATAAAGAGKPIRIEESARPRWLDRNCAGAVQGTDALLGEGAQDWSTNLADITFMNNTVPLLRSWGYTDFSTYQSALLFWYTANPVRAYAAAGYAPDVLSHLASTSNTGLAFAALAPYALLSWTASPSPNVVGYNVYRTETQGASCPSAYTKIKDSSAQSASPAKDYNILRGHTYYYAVTAVNNTAQESVCSMVVSVLFP